MKNKILLLSFSLFLIPGLFFGQEFNQPASLGNTTESFSGNLILNSEFIEQDVQAGIKSSSESNEVLVLKLSCDANSSSDEAIVIFNNSDPSQGAVKLMSIYASAPELWSVKNGEKYSISMLGGLDSTVIVPITVKAGIPGTYTLVASQLESFGANTEILLEDRVSGSFVNLDSSSAYTFRVSETATIADRFFLRFRDITFVSPKDLTAVPDKEAVPGFTVYSVDGVISVTSRQKQSSKITVFDLRGCKIATGCVGEGAHTQIDMHGKAGVYIVSVYTGQVKSNTKIIVN